MPATSEIVIEGEIRPHERREEGPFGEYTGYMATHRSPKMLIRVKAITFRNDPILTMTCEGVPCTDTHAIVGIVKSGEFLEALRAQGMPVTGVCSPVEGADMFTVVAVKVPYANVAGEIANIIWATRLGKSTPYIVVVDDDVDPFNLGEVVHAMMTKCHPYQGIVKIERAVGSTLNPWASRYEHDHLIGGRAYFDCTWPKTWAPEDTPKKSSLAVLYPPEIQQKALARWHRYGY